MKIRPEFMPSQKSHMMSQQQVVRFTHWPEIVKFLRVVMVRFLSVVLVALLSSSELF